VERYLFGGASVALITLGVGLVLRPAAVIALNRDAGEERRPPTAGQILRARILGVVLMAGGGYFLYALLTGMPGAEFSPARGRRH
jgi:hypothetical protein